ncbi:hypothetical protein N7533_005599 [Penicillium manginii]|uniref:uncharacterized protein n=1 Tax=Penicillium manginii TaxID=203109 RepID=UPI002548A3D3|nr:uncharacterized protein N7533_005599 [Penicillium manginii]KAJ5756056.1 hypothetical protein N7533_005599 [Penicillium manginii]
MVSLEPIDLFQGRPAPDLLPTEHLKNAAVKALSDKSVSDPGLGYGPDEGYFPLRQNIASWLSAFYETQQPANAERICITGGASQNLNSILSVFTDPLLTRMVWLVEPTYHLVFRSFEDAGFHGRMRGIPEDEEGMDADALEGALGLFEEGEDSIPDMANKTSIKPHKSYRKIYRHVIYCVPSFSNPSGTTMTTSRRESLVRIARKFDALIVCDDVYDFLNWDLQDVKHTPSSFQRLVDIDRTLDGGPSDYFGNVVSNGTFSKLIGPGCRVGWAEGTVKFAYGLSQAGQNISGGAPCQLMSTFVNELLEGGILEQHIATVLIPHGRRRHLAILAAVKEHLSPLGAMMSSDINCLLLSRRLRFVGEHPRRKI